MLRKRRIELSLTQRKVKRSIKENNKFVNEFQYFYHFSQHRILCVFEHLPAFL